MNSVGVNLGEFRCSEALKAYNKALMDYKKTGLAYQSWV